MIMPFNIWQDPCPAKLYILKIKHDIYYQLHCIYHKLVYQLKFDYDKPEKLPLLNALKDILITGLTIPLPFQVHSFGEIEKLQNDFPAPHLLTEELKKELNELLLKLQDNPATPIFLALEHLFLNNPISELANIGFFNFSVKYFRDFDTIKKVFDNNEFNSFCQLSLLKDVIKRGSINPLIITGLVSWNRKILTIPPAKTIILITPSWYEATIENSNPFTTCNTTIGLSLDALILPPQVTTLSLYTNENIKQKHSINDVMTSEIFQDSDLCEESLSHFKLAKDWMIFEPGKKQIIIDRDNQIRHEILYSINQLTIGEYWVDIENKNRIENITQNTLNIIEQMEEWKKPMRQFETQPHLLVKKLKSYGALNNINEQNVSDWMKPSYDRIHAPQDLENNFRAILFFAGVLPEKHDEIIQLIKELRSSNRLQGKLINVDLINQAIYELKILLSITLLTRDDSQELDNGNYIFYLRKITDIY